MSDTEMTEDSETEGKDNLLSPGVTRSTKSDVEDAYTDDEEAKPKLTFQAVSHATLAIVRARRKVKDHIKLMSAKQAQKNSASGMREQL